MISSFVSNHSWTQWWQPNPVEINVLSLLVANDCVFDLLRDDISQRARWRGQGHVDNNSVLALELFEPHVIDQAEVNNVDAQLWVNDVAHVLCDVVDLGDLLFSLLGTLARSVEGRVLVLVRIGSWICISHL